MPTLKIDQTPFLQVSMAAERFSTVYDGFIGIAPYVSSDLVRESNQNFMYNLKYRHNVIDHMIASVFITSDSQHFSANTENYLSSIKFGSYDPNALEEGSTLEMMKTKDTSTWAVSLHRATVMDATF